MLHTANYDAFWITSWPFAEYVQHAWAGAWMCSAFRNESSILSSDLIKEALAATRAHYGAAPPLGMVTFIDKKKVRAKKNPGYCYLLAGFKYVGHTKKGLVAMQILEDDMPQPESALGSQQGLLI